MAGERKRFCPECGAPRKQGAGFCGACGHPFGRDTARKTAEPAEKISSAVTQAGSVARTGAEAVDAAARAGRWQVVVGGALPGTAMAAAERAAAAAGRKATEMAGQEAAEAVTAGGTPSPPGEPRRCRVCGHAVGPQAGYCGRCGSAVSPTPDSRPPGPACPSCGKAFQPGERFCSFCGVQVRGKE